MTAPTDTEHLLIIACVMLYKSKRSKREPEDVFDFVVSEYIALNLGDAKGPLKV